MWINVEKLKNVWATAYWISIIIVAVNITRQKRNQNIYGQEPKNEEIFYTFHRITNISLISQPIVPKLVAMDRWMLVAWFTA